MPGQVLVSGGSSWQRKLILTHSAADELQPGFSLLKAHPCFCSPLLLGVNVLWRTQLTTCSVCHGSTSSVGPELHLSFSQFCETVSISDKLHSLSGPTCKQTDVSSGELVANFKLIILHFGPHLKSLLSWQPLTHSLDDLDLLNFSTWSEQKAWSATSQKSLFLQRHLRTLWEMYPLHNIKIFPALLGQNRIK